MSSFELVRGGQFTISNKLMNKDFANHFLALLSCILRNILKYIYLHKSDYVLMTYIK